MSCSRLIEFVEQKYIGDFVRDRLIPAATDNPTQIMASLSRNFLQSSTNILSAICTLAKLEFGDEPLILARTIFEYSMHIAYIHAGGESRARAFVVKGYEEQKRRRCELSKLKEQGKCLDWIKDMEAATWHEAENDLTKSVDQFPSFKNMAKDLGEPYECDWHFIYWSISKAVHPNDINSIARNPSEDAKRALLLGFNYHYRIARIVCASLEQELDAKVQEFLGLVDVN